MRAIKPFHVSITASAQRVKAVILDVLKKYHANLEYKMQNELFNQSDIDAGLNIIIISYFDRMYEDGDFIKAIALLTEKVALNKDGAYCAFGDMDNYCDDFHFNGVEFAMGYPPSEAEEVIVSEEECYKYVRLACERYIKFHPKNMKIINNLLEKMPY